jgi:hypothetical protein
LKRILGSKGESMSGGHFDYIQFRVEDAADEIENIVENNDSTEKNDFGDETGRHYPPEVIGRFLVATHYIKAAAKMLHRIDWLLSADDGEETFLRRWDEDVAPLIKNP